MDPCYRLSMVRGTSLVLRHDEPSSTDIRSSRGIPCVFLHNLLPHFTIITTLMEFESYRPVALFAENPLIQLYDYEVIILMDDSRSMLGTRWNQVRYMFLSTVTGVGVNCLCIRRSKL